MQVPGLEGLDAGWGADAEFVLDAEFVFVPEADLARKPGTDSPAEHSIEAVFADALVRERKMERSRV
jgi:hypothetical protein